MSSERSSYPSDVSDEEWALVAPYLALVREDSGQRDHDLREVFNGLRYIVKTGAPWRFMPHDLPPWAAVFQQMQRWLSAASFADVAHDLRAVLRIAAERKKSSKTHVAVGAPGHVSALSFRLSGLDDRTKARWLTASAEALGERHIERGFVDQDDTGLNARPAARAHGIELAVVKAPEAKRGFVLLPRHWVVERTFAWATRCRRLVKDYERYGSSWQVYTRSASSASCSGKSRNWQRVHNSLSG